MAALRARSVAARSFTQPNTCSRLAFDAARLRSLRSRNEHKTDTEMETLQSPSQKKEVYLLYQPNVKSRYQDPGEAPTGVFRSTSSLAPNLVFIPPFSSSAGCHRVSRRFGEVEVGSGSSTVRQYHGRISLLGHADMRSIACNW